MQGLNEKNMQAVINSYDLKPYYHTTLFPVKNNITLTWKALEIQTGLRVAADVVARGASIDRKTRTAVSRVQGDIPKISILRDKDENELNEYFIMLAMSQNNPNQRALVEAWAEDMKFCWDGVANRVEWMALQQISLGKLTLTDKNNVGIVTEYDVDYKLDELGQKQGYATGSAAWNLSTAAKPISVDFKATIESAKAKGIRLRYAFMNLDTFTKFAACKEVQDLCASYLQVALDLTTSPSVEQVNKALNNIAYLRGLQIVVLDQDITVELSDGSQTTGNPFADNVVMFSETKQLGQTYYNTPVDMSMQGSHALKVMNGYTCIKKFSEENPIREITMGIANVFPAWLSSTRSYLMDVANSTWNK